MSNTTHRAPGAKARQPFWITSFACGIKVRAKVERMPFTWAGNS